MYSVFSEIIAEDKWNYQLRFKLGLSFQLKAFYQIITSNNL